MGRWRPAIMVLLATSCAGWPTAAATRPAQAQLALAPRSDALAPLGAPAPAAAAPERSTVAILGLSWGLTAAVAGAGALTLMSGGDSGTDFAGLAMIWSGIMAAPAVGSFYSGHPGLGSAGLLLRLLGSLWFVRSSMSAALDDSWDGSGHDDNEWKAALVFTIGEAVVEPLIAVLMSAREEPRPAGFTIAPALIPSRTPGSATPGLALVGVF